MQRPRRDEGPSNSGNPYSSPVSTRNCTCLSSLGFVRQHEGRVLIDRSSNLGDNKNMAAQQKSQSLIATNLSQDVKA